jgi:uncharacterized protein YjiK
LKKLTLAIALSAYAGLALANVWYQKPIEQFSTKAKEEILAPLQAKKNFSGLTYVPELKSFFAIINKGNTIFEFDENFNLKREIAIKGFDDPEDLTFVKMSPQGPIFAISEEPGRLLLGVIPAAVKELNASSMKALRLVDEAGRALQFVDNKGLEGITFIPETATFVVVKEKGPMKMWSFTLAEAANASTIKVKNFLPAETEQMINSLVTDLSAVSYHAKTKSVVFLSDESSKIIYVDHMKEVSKIIDIKTKLQHEGLSFSADFETTYVGSEPYYLIRINKTNTIQGQSL